MLFYIFGNGASLSSISFRIFLTVTKGLVLFSNKLQCLIICIKRILIFHLWVTKLRMAVLSSSLCLGDELGYSRVNAWCNIHLYNLFLAFFVSVWWYSTKGISFWSQSKRCFCFDWRCCWKTLKYFFLLKDGIHDDKLMFGMLKEESAIWDFFFQKSPRMIIMVTFWNRW